MKHLRARTLSKNPEGRQERPSEIRVTGKRNWQQWIVDATEKIQSEEPIDRTLGILELRLAVAHNQDISSTRELLTRLRRDLDFLAVANEAGKALVEMEKKDDSSKNGKVIKMKKR